MSNLEIVRPDALKQLMSGINGNTVRVSSMDLALRMLNWPRCNRHPPRWVIEKAGDKLYTLFNNPPVGFEVDELPGKYFTVSIRRVH